MRCRSLVNGLGEAGAFNRSGYRTDNLVQQVMGPPYRLECPGENIQANGAEAFALRASVPPIGAVGIGMRVYYLSSAPFALSNLALRRLKISRFGDLNDPFELLAANLVNAKHRWAFEAMKGELNSTKGLICFSQTWSNPLLWGHYAEKHTGIALGFDIPDHLLAPINYTEKRVRLPVDKSTDRVVLSDDVVGRLLITKFSDWAYEQEMRVFVQLDDTTREAGMYFMDFSSELNLMEVILGPRCEFPISRIRDLVSKEFPEARVSKARMAFRTFRVTEDRSFRPGGTNA